MQSKYSKGEVTWDERLAENFQVSSPSGVTYSMLNAPATDCNSMCEYVDYQGNLFETHCLRLVCIEELISRHPLPATYQNSRIPKRKQVFSMNYILCRNSLGTMRDCLSVRVV